jgi:hypothetical protein
MSIFAPGNGLAAMPASYVLETDTDGNFITPVGPQGNGTSNTTGVAANSDGRVVAVGVYTGTAIFTGSPLQVQGVVVPFVATLGNTSGNNGGSGGSSGVEGPVTSGSLSPALVADQPIASGRGRKKTIVGFTLFFNTSLDAATASDPTHYQVTQPGRTRHSARTLVPLLAAQVGAGGVTVTLILGKHSKSKPLFLTASGLISAGGTPSVLIARRL